MFVKQFLTLPQMRGPKWILDVSGHYARPDVFELTVNRQPYHIIRTSEGAVDDKVTKKILAKGKPRRRSRK
jgi:hypothetical protein